jgi:hypothetical protein
MAFSTGRVRARPLDNQTLAHLPTQSRRATPPHRCPALTRTRGRHLGPLYIGTHICLRNGGILEAF